MKNWIFSIHKKDAWIGLLILLFFETILKQQLQYNSKVIIFLLIITIIIFRFRFHKKILAIFTIAFLPYIIIHLAYCFFDTPLHKQLHSVTTKAAFIVFPFIFSQIPFIFYPNFLQKTAKFLTGALFFIFCYMVYFAMIKFNVNHDWGNFFYSGLCWPVMHTGYLSNFFLFCFLYFYFSFKKNKNIWHLIIVAILLSMLVLIACKTAYLCLIIFSIVASYQWIKTIKKATNKIILFVALCASAYGIFSIAPIQKRIVELLNTNKVAVQDVNTTHSSPIRKLIWKSEWEIIKRNPIVGYGTGAADSLLVIEYKKNNYTYLLDNVSGRPLHSHNQFLHQWIDQGILGLLTLVFLLGYCCIYFIKNKYWMGAWWIIFMFFVIFTDDVLEIHVCVVFIAFAISLLIWDCMRINYGKQAKIRLV